MSEIHMYNLVGLSASLEGIIVESIRRTWARLRDDSAEFFVILDYKHEDSSLGYYNHEVNVIGIAPHLVTGWNMPQAQMLAIIAGHETTHKVQNHYGVKMIPSYRNWMYDDGVDENQAWQEGVITASEMFPDVPFRMIVGSNEFCAGLK